MSKFLKSSHVVYRCEYHFVWVPKYRYRVLIGEVRERLREILRELCEWQEIMILEGAIKEDHVHMYLSVPPKHSPSHVMKILKGKSAEYWAREFPELAKRYWGMHIWARGYCVSTVGINEETIREYIKSSRKRKKKKTKGDYGKTTANDIVRSCCLLTKPPTRSVVVYCCLKDVSLT